jgi:hypothetical protein
VQAVDGQHNHDGEVGNEQHRIEAVPAIEALEGLVSVLLLEEVAEAILRRQEPERQRVVGAEDESESEGAGSSECRDQGGSLPSGSVGLRYGNYRRLLLGCRFYGMKHFQNGCRRFDSETQKPCAIPLTKMTFVASYKDVGAGGQSIHQNASIRTGRSFSGS